MSSRCWGFQALVFCSPLLVGFAEQEWAPLDFGAKANPIIFERCGKEVLFETTGSVHVECSFPIFPGGGTLIDQVNWRLKTEAESRFDNFVQGEIFSEEMWEDGCTLSYELYPVCQRPNLISIFGCDFQGRGCHGCTYYEGKTFWRKGDSVVQLVLDDLFVEGGGYRQFLLQYCEDYFRDTGYGYYSSRCEFLPELGPNDLDIFVPTDEGLVIVFKAYTIWGWADGPNQVLIPYAKLKEYIDPFGPLQEM